MPNGFVTVEGIDGSGKTTVSRIVYENLRSRGLSVHLTSEPTHGWLGDHIRRAIDEDIGPIPEAFLFLADRAVHIPQIRSRLESGDLVLCDRYADSTYAYQGARLAGILPDPIKFLQRASEPWLLTPDLTILLRIAPDIALSRIKGRPNRIRFEDKRLLEEVAANYDRLSKARRFVVIEAARAAETVADDVIRAIERRLELRIPPG